MRIERISYKGGYSKTVPYKKEVLTKIDDHHYLRQHYLYRDNCWADCANTSYFDGKEVHNGIVCFCHEFVEDKFTLLIAYEHYVEVKEE